MRRVTAIASALLVSAAVAAPAAAADAATTAKPTRTQLKAALLTARDLPAGYAAASSSGGDGKVTDRNSCAKRWDSSTGTPQATAHASRGFEKDGALGALVENDVAVFASASKAKAGVAALASMVHSCSTARWIYADGVHMTLVVKKAAAPRLGDQSYAASVRMTASTSGLSFTGRGTLVVVRRKRATTDVLTVGFLDRAASAPALARKAAVKLARLPQ